MIRALRSLALVAVAFALPLAPSPAAAAFPERPVRLIVPFPAGGPTDGMARLVGQQLSKQLGQPVVIDNRGGAGGTIATEAAASAAPDGYSLFFSTLGTMAINPSLYRSMKVDPAKAFVAVGAVASTANVLVTGVDFPAGTLQELVALARSKPGTVTYGSAGSGSSNHLSGELLRTMAGIEIVHVPYKGSGAALTDLLGGRISFMFDTVSSLVPQLAAGKLKALGITSPARSPALPNVPTIAEAGLPGFEVTIWFGLSAPRGTPADVVARLNAELQNVLANAEIRAQLDKLGAAPMPGTPQDFATRIEQDAAKWSALVKASGASVD